MKQVLFLCTGNSARSIIAAIAILRAKGIDTSFARSKSWDEFATPYDGAIDIVITVCGNAADETCPVWSGHPVTAHWGVEDPAGVREPADAVERAFAKTYDEMYRRIMAFLALDTTKDQSAWISDVRAIGSIDD